MRNGIYFPNVSFFLRLLCCPFCEGELTFERSSEIADESAFGVLSCNCDRYPVCGGHSIFKKGPVGSIGGRPCEPWQVINLIEAGRHREALFAVLLPPPPLNAPPGWQEEAEALFTTTENQATVCDLVDFYFGQTGGWSAFTSIHYFLFRFGQSRQLMALSLANLIEKPRKPVLDPACGIGHIDSQFGRASGRDSESLGFTAVSSYFI